MKLGLVSDVHGDPIGLELAWSHLTLMGADRIVCAGDLVGYGPFPDRVVSFLCEHQVASVRGNHDRWVTDWPLEKHSPTDAFAFQTLDSSQLAWLRALPPTLELGSGIFACHGRPNDDNAYLLENVEEGRLVSARRAQVAERVWTVAARFVLCGHSHIAGVATAGDKIIVNPGSVGQPAYEDPASPAHVSESGSPAARYAVLQVDPNQTSLEHIAITYDHLVAARRAEENQNPAWAHFLSTGYARDSAPGTLGRRGYHHEFPPLPRSCGHGPGSGPG